VEGIGTQQEPRLFLTREPPLHDVRLKLWALSQPGEEIVQIDSIIRHRNSLRIGPTAGNSDQNVYESVQSADRLLCLSHFPTLPTPPVAPSPTKNPRISLAHVTSESSSGS